MLHLKDWGITSWSPKWLCISATEFMLDTNSVALTIHSILYNWFFFPVVNLFWSQDLNSEWHCKMKGVFHSFSHACGHTHTHTQTRIQGLAHISSLTCSPTSSAQRNLPVSCARLSSLIFPLLRKVSAAFLHCQQEEVGSLFVLPTAPKQSMNAFWTDAVINQSSSTNTEQNLCERLLYQEGFIS